MYNYNVFVIYIFNVYNYSVYKVYNLNVNIYKFLECVWF